MQAKYPNPDNIDYGNMNLRDELQTRFDLDEMNNLSTKLGAPSGLAVGNDNGAPVQDLSQRLSGNDTEAQNSFYKPLSRPNKDNANCYMTFDGQSLNLVGGNPTHQYTLNAIGRSGFSIHGGWKKGSAGCIDIPWQTGKLSRYLDDCQDNVPVYVKYTKEKW